jgi:hypothetical protein
MRIFVFSALVLLLCPFIGAQSLEHIVAGMEVAQMKSRSTVRPYSATRDYTVFKSADEKGAIKVAMEHRSPQEVTFKILESTGGMAEHAVRKALEKEAQLARSPEASEITPRNYAFELLGKQRLPQSDCYVLKITPHEKDKDLLDGRVWVDVATYQIRRVEGRVSKSPSFWVRQLDLVINFGEVNGIWLKTSSDAVAHIRWAGEYRVLAQDSAVALLQSPVMARRAPSTARLRRTAAALAASEPALQP